MALGGVVVIRSRLGIRAALICAWLLALPHLVPQAPAQPQSTGAECAAAIDAKTAELNQLEAQLQALTDRAVPIVFKGQAATAAEREELNTLNDDRKKLEPKIAAARADLEKLRAACGKGSAGPAYDPNAPLPPLPPEVQIVRHSEPVAACSACADDAMRASEALYTLLRAESAYLVARGNAYRKRVELSRTDNPRASDKYKELLVSYLSSQRILSDSERALADAIAAFNSAAIGLAACNATRCKDSPIITLGSPLFVAPDDEPKAACPDCEGFVLEVKKNLALLRVARMEFQRAIARRDAINQLQRDLTEAERIELTRLDGQIKGYEARMAYLESQIAGYRDDLDSCNKDCPPKTTPGPGLPPSGATDTGAKGGTGALPGAPATTGPGAGTGKPSGPDVKTPPPTGGPGGTGGQGAPPETPPSKKPVPQTPPAGTGMVVPEGGRQSMAHINVGPGYVPDVKSTAVFALEPGAFASEPRKYSFFFGSGPSYTVTSTAAISTIVAAGSDFGRYPLYRLPNGEYSMDLNASQLEILQGSLNTKTGGKSSQPAINVTNNPCVSMQPILADAQGQPIAGAYIIVGPPSPTPLFNPGERDGDDRPPTIMRTGSDGSYSLPTGLTGPIEIGVAKGCDSYSSTATIDGTPGPRGGASSRRFAQSSGAAR